MTEIDFTGFLLVHGCSCVEDRLSAGIVWNGARP